MLVLRDEGGRFESQRASISRGGGRRNNRQEEEEYGTYRASWSDLIGRSQGDKGCVLGVFQRVHARELLKHCLGERMKGKKRTILEAIGGQIWWSGKRMEGQRRRMGLWESWEGKLHWKCPRKGRDQC